MKAAQLKSLIRTYSEALSLAPASDVSSHLAGLADFIGQGGTQSAAKFFENFEKSERACSDPVDRGIGELLPVLERLLSLLKEAGAKKAVLTDVQLLLDVVRRNSQLSLSDIESVSRKSVASASRGKNKPGEQLVDAAKLIDAYLKKLEAALGSDVQFRAVFRELDHDRRISKAEAVAIASKFFQPMPASTSRPKALQAVLRRHEKLMESRAASATIGGRAA